MKGGKNNLGIKSEGPGREIGREEATMNSNFKRRRVRNCCKEKER